MNARSEAALAVTTALVHARRRGGENRREQRRVVEMGSGTGVRNGARGEQPFCRESSCRMQRMKAASPPGAALVRVGAELQQHLDHVRIAGTGHQRWRVEGEKRHVDHGPEFRMARQQLPRGGGVAAHHRVMQLLVRCAHGLCARLQVVLERGPIGEAVLPRQHELCVGENEAHLVRKDCSDARDGVAVVTVERLQQFPGLAFLLGEIGARRKLAAGGLCHGTPPSNRPASAPSARRGRVESSDCVRWALPFPRTGGVLKRLGVLSPRRGCAAT